MTCSIGLFVEDIAQVNFASSLIERIFAECGLGPLGIETRNGTGGASQVQARLETYFSDYQRLKQPSVLSYKSIE